MTDIYSGAGFKLRGTTYHLTIEEVERRLEAVEPRPLEKYSVIVGGRAFPPKQVLSEALGIPVLNFTTMDANRILGRIGFEVIPTGQRSESHRVTGAFGAGKSQAIGPDAPQLFLDPSAPKRLFPCSANPSRQVGFEEKVRHLFEAYLFTSGLREFTSVETNDDGSTPDIVITLGNTRVLIEAKMISAGESDSLFGLSAYDPCRPIREKIAMAQEELKSQLDACRCLLLFSQSTAFPMLKWQFIYWSMLGTGKVAAGERSPGTAELDAVLVLEQLPVGYLRLQSEWECDPSTHGDSLEEYLATVKRARGTEKDVTLSQLRLIVHDNPFAQVPLPKEIFQGPYDERYGLTSNGKVGRIFCGEQIQALQRRSGRNSTLAKQ